jgi:hypothetical protein
MPHDFHKEGKTRHSTNVGENLHCIHVFFSLLLDSFLSLVVVNFVAEDDKSCLCRKLVNKGKTVEHYSMLTYAYGVITVGKGGNGCG